MSLYERFLAFLTALLGDEHELVVRLSEAEPTEDVTVPEGTSEDAAEFIAALASLDDDTVTELRDGITEFVRADEDGAISRDDLVLLGDSFDALTETASVREQAAEAEQAERDELLARFQADEPEADEETDEPEVEETDEAETPDEPEVEEVVEEPVAVTASTQPRIRNVRPHMPARRTPTAQASQGATEWNLLEPVSGQGGVGDRLDDSRMIEAFTQRVNDLAAMGPDATANARVARLDYRDSFDELHHLGSNAEENGRRIEEAIAEAKALARSAATPGDAVAALTAAGGVCAPAMPLYDIPVAATRGRPIRDFLNPFNADRGGVTFRPGYSLETMGEQGQNTSGVGVHTNTEDQASQTKPVFTVTCPSTETVTVQAITARFRFGNFQDRFDPESVQALRDLQLSFMDRTAEEELLAQIDAGSVDVDAPALDASGEIGAGRAVLVALDRYVAAVRWTERLGEGSVVDALAPIWLRDMIRADLTLEMPGSTDDRFATAEAEINRWFQARGIRVGWFWDSRSGDGIAPHQSGANGLAGFPLTVQIRLFDPGHHIALDGGLLDLGVYRDSTLTAQNNAEMFAETFEAIASRGVFSHKVDIPVCITGAAAGLADVDCYGGS